MSVFARFVCIWAQPTARQTADFPVPIPVRATGTAIATVAAPLDPRDRCVAPFEREDAMPDHRCVTQTTDEASEKMRSWRRFWLVFLGSAALLGLTALIHGVLSGDAVSQRRDPYVASNQHTPSEALVEAEPTAAPTSSLRNATAASDFVPDVPVKPLPPPRGDADAELLHKVRDRLLAVAEKPEKVPWPPVVKIQETEDPGNINAGAAIIRPAGPTGPALSIIVVFRPMMRQVVQGDADRLAWVLGHEMSHLMLGHCSGDPKGQTEFVRRTFTRFDELAADRAGMKLALKAGFSKQKGLAAVHRIMALEAEGHRGYSSFEGQGVDHPNWKERLVHLDREQASLWRAMAAFETGEVFLRLEQYASAARCFREVTREFPECPEAWANLGYALLMLYCDELDSADLRGRDMGAIAVGGFYRRPDSLRPEPIMTEGPPKAWRKILWSEALAALQESVRLNAHQALPTASLGVSYLVRPEGMDAPRALRYLNEAADLAAVDCSLEPVQQASILINAGTAVLAIKEPDAAAQRFRQAEEAMGATPGPEYAELRSALRYNRGLLLATSQKPDDRRRAAAEFENYLENTSPAATWWPVGYDRYRTLCKELKIAEKSRQQLEGAAGPAFRLVTSVEVNGGVIAIEQTLDDARRVAGIGEAVPVVTGRGILRLHYPDRGLDIIAADKVLAIVSYGPSGPAVTLRESGLGGKAHLLRPGMPEAEVRKLLKDQPFRTQKLYQADLLYRYYPTLGFAVRTVDGKVVEIVVAQLSRLELRRPTGP